MATEVIKIVDPDNGSGTNYTSLSAWEAGEQGDLTGARDEIAVAKCRCTGGTADTSAQIIGWTTDATRYIKIWTDPSENYRHSGKWDASKYRIEVASYSSIDIGAENVWVDGIQIKGTNSSSQLRFFATYSLTTSAVLRVSNCILVGQGGSTYRTLLFPTVTGNRPITYMWNCITYNWSEYWNSYCRLTSDQYAYFYNCTFIFNGSDRGLRRENGTLTVKNCYVAGTLYGDYYGTMTKETCASEDSTGSTGLTGIAHSTSNFVNVTSGSEDYHLVNGSALIGVGTNLYNDTYLPFQTDIDGQDRGGSGATWDIGADEYLNSSLPPQLLTPQRSIQHLLVR